MQSINILHEPYCHFHKNRGLGTLCGRLLKSFRSRVFIARQDADLCKVFCAKIESKSLETPLISSHPFAETPTCAETSVCAKTPNFSVIVLVLLRVLRDA